MRRIALFTGAVIVSSFAALLLPAAARAQEPPPPAVTRLDGELPQQLKVKRAKTGHLLVSPQIDGQEAGWFIFDTGAGLSCVDKKLAEKLALPASIAATAEGTGGDEATRLLKIKSLQFGPIRIEDSVVVELNLAPIGLAMGEQIDGVIGYECFMAGVFEVDFDEAKITVHDAASYKLADGQEWHKVSFAKRRPLLPGQIEGHRKGLFLMDLGANNSLVINGPTVKQLDLLKDRPTSASMTGGVGGMRAARKGAVKELCICGQTRADVPALFTEAAEGTHANDEVQGTVGVGFLRNFRVVLDYKGARAALLPRS